MPFHGACPGREVVVARATSSHLRSSVQARSQIESTLALIEGTSCRDLYEFCGVAVVVVVPKIITETNTPQHSHNHLDPGFNCEQVAHMEVGGIRQGWRPPLPVLLSRAHICLARTLACVFRGRNANIISSCVFHPGCTFFAGVVSLLII